MADKPQDVFTPEVAAKVSNILTFTPTTYFSVAMIYEDRETGEMMLETHTTLFRRLDDAKTAAHVISDALGMSGPITEAEMPGMYIFYHTDGEVVITFHTLI